MMATSSRAQNFDGGAIASAQNTDIQMKVHAGMAESERIRNGNPEPIPRVGSRSDRSFGVTNEGAYVDGVLQTVADGESGAVRVKSNGAESAGTGGSDETKVEGEEKDGSQLKRRMSKMVSRAVAKVRGPSVARGL